MRCRRPQHLARNLAVGLGPNQPKCAILLEPQQRHMAIMGYMYILLCANGSYYTGSTKHLQRRLRQHREGKGANHTKKYGPVELVYFETFSRIDHAFYREKQVQGWKRAKKEALIRGDVDLLPKFAECKNWTHYKNRGASPPLSAPPEEDD